MRFGALALALALLLLACSTAPDLPEAPARTVVADPAPAMEYLDLLGATLAKNIPTDFDVRSLDWSIGVLTRALVTDLEYSPDLTPYGKSCEEAHTDMRGLIRSWIRVAELGRLEDWDEAKRERVRGDALFAEVEESMYRCERGL